MANKQTSTRNLGAVRWLDDQARAQTAGASRPTNSKSFLAPLT